MPEDKNIIESPDLAGGGLERLAVAVKRIESLLGKTLADYEALRQEHEQLKRDFMALKARTQSVGDEMDETIGRLKKWMAADNMEENEGEAWAR